MRELYEKLIDYNKKDYYPFHMPGHKRNPFSLEKNLPWGMDITEIEGFDNLHHPETIIKNAQKNAADLYGSSESFFSVNGSTAALLSAISACVKPGGKILLGRNCHKSVYHGIYLRGLKSVYLYPSFIHEFHMNGGISPKDVREALKREPDIEAVLVTSPTYDGVVSDVREISEIVHEKGIPLIVDEAHGAHFMFSDFFPKSAVCLGADLVIQSLHKTLPSLTQTALLHRCSERVSGKAIQKFMGIYQSSSPSYLLMASIDWCIGFLATEAEKFYQSYIPKLMKMRENLEKLQNFYVVGKEITGRNQVYDFDLSKILICIKSGIMMSGHELSSILREYDHLEMEMEAENYILGISSVFDTEEGMGRLSDAMGRIDLLLEKKKGRDSRETIVIKEKNDFHRAVQKLKISEAMDSTLREVPLFQSQGEISGEFVYLYPPGIPLIAPGEMITEEILESLKKYKKQGLKVQGMDDFTGRMIKIVG